jgi:uncharacterized protein (TIGR03083 family)
MLLTPVYGSPSYLCVELSLGDPAVPVLRQRRRLASFLGTLSDEQWAAASRCEGWSVHDVVAHLVTTNQFWALSIQAARAGEPTELLATFDPVATPPQLVDASRAERPAVELERFVESTEAMATAMAGLDDRGWSVLGEAPPGHVPLTAVALHALWDSWVHERDILLPLGLTPVEEADEVAGSLAYAAALGPLFAVATATAGRGSLAVDATSPATRFVVDVDEPGAGAAHASVVVRNGEAPADAVRLAGPAVDLLEALSFRRPMPAPVPDTDHWLLSGLATVFDRA